MTHNMKIPIPNNLLNSINEPVLRFIEEGSAHSDISEKLILSTIELGDANIYCPEASNYKSVAIWTNDIIFGLAFGMNTIAFRQNIILKQRAIISGANELLEINNDWVSFTLFRADWPEPDLSFWALKAYTYAREERV